MSYLVAHTDDSGSSHTDVCNNLDDARLLAWSITRSLNTQQARESIRTILVRPERTQK